jgi:hypothetical protein
MKNKQQVSNHDLFSKPGWSLLFAVSLLMIGALSMPPDAGAQVVNVGSVGNLQTALTSAQNNGMGDTIMVAAGFYAVGTTLTFTTTEDFPLAIIGEGAHDTTLDGGLTNEILNINIFSLNAPVTVRDISFWRGTSTGSLQPGLAVGSNSSVAVENCLFTRNTGGTAAFINAFNGPVTLTNNIFSGNYADGHSALYVQISSGDIILTNNTFIGNRSSTNTFSAIFLESQFDGDVINAYNNIVWGAYDKEASFDIISPSPLGTVNAFNNISRGLSIGSIGTVSQGNNLLGTDPLFQIPGYWDTNGTPADQSDDFWVDGDYHLTSISPARDTGLNNAPGLPTTDFDGNLRILNSIVDRGAYEFEPAFVDIEISDSAGDLDDLSIDFGSVVVGDTSSIETVTVTNDGTLPLLIGSVVAPSAPFIMSDSCSNGSLGPGNDCTVDLQFIPATEGSFSGTLSIPSNDPDTPLAVVSVSGIGTAVPVPVI